MKNGRQSRPSSRDAVINAVPNVYGGHTKVLMENGDLDHLVTTNSLNRKFTTREKHTMILWSD